MTLRSDSDEHDLFRRLKRLVSEKTGLQIPESGGKQLQNAVAERMRLRKLATPEEYCRTLADDTADSAAEWNEFTALLISGETFFFRDKPQFSLIQNKILPELIEAKAEKSSLRIWSAGCATGEEPYSLAMLVDQLLPRREDWDILILGTDTNQASLEKAQRGIYSPWSFRPAAPEFQQRYFNRRNDGWQLDERIRGMVKFRAGNLAGNTIADRISEVRDMDLVLCRNVFIYFDRKTVSAILEKIVDSLAVGGYLVTGHGELFGCRLDRLKIKIFPESIIYRRVAKPLQIAHKEISAVPKAVRQAPEIVIENKIEETPSARIPTPDPASNMNRAEEFFRDGAYASAAEKARQVSNAEPRHFGAVYLMARAYANLGDYDQAVDCCRRALHIDPLAANPYHLLAQIAQLRGEFDEAKTLLKKAIYLAPAFVAAYLDLGSLHERDGDSVRALKARKTALEILKTLPPGAVVEPYEMTADETLRHAKKILE